MIFFNKVPILIVSFALANTMLLKTIIVIKEIFILTLLMYIEVPQNIIT